MNWKDNCPGSTLVSELGQREGTLSAQKLCPLQVAIIKKPTNKPCQRSVKFDPHPSLAQSSTNSERGSDSMCQRHLNSLFFTPLPPRPGEAAV